MAGMPFEVFIEIGHLQEARLIGYFFDGIIRIDEQALNLLDENGINKLLSRFVDNALGNVIERLSTFT